MEKTELIRGRKYRLVTRWGESIARFLSIDKESGNPVFVVHRFPTTIIPWGAILELEQVEKGIPCKFSHDNRLFYD